MQKSLTVLDRMHGSRGKHGSNLTAAEDTLIVAAYHNADGQIRSPQRQLHVAQQDILDMAEAVCWSLQAVKVLSSEFGGACHYWPGHRLVLNMHCTSGCTKGNHCDAPLPPGSCCMQAGSKLAVSGPPHPL